MSHPSSRPEVQGFFDPSTATVTYVVHAGPGTACAIIDSVLDYDPKSGRTRTVSADKVSAMSSNIVCKCGGFSRPMRTPII